MQDSDLPTFVVDTHTLFWYFGHPHRLSPAADAVFRLAATGGAHIIVPAIVIAEFYYLTLKAGSPVLPSTVLDLISRSAEFIFSELGQTQLEAMEQVTGVPEMHDRLIAAEGLVHQAPIITRDTALRTSGIVKVVW